MVDSFICNFIKYLISSNFFILKNGVVKYGCNYLTMKEITNIDIRYNVKNI
ncbi:MAG TPA: hypothetical protein VFP07_01010 [Buchnera sp. (in: enterobacteria)]|nr:hypothetical protein [Buchnera sp. (in: enterobacteria)]